MAKTFSDLQVETRIYLEEAQQDDWLDSEVKIAINRAYHDLTGRIITLYQSFYETFIPFKYAVVANQQEYLIDQSLIKVTRVEINYAPQQSGSTPLRAIPVKMEEALLNISNSASSGAVFNAGYYLHGNLTAQYIGFIPLPTQSDTTALSISVWGIQLPSDLSANADNVLIPYADNYSYLIALRAAAQLLRKGQQEEAVAGTYLGQYELGVKNMMDFLAERQADGVQMVIDVELDNMDFQTNPPF
jgi:hypothetical protein